jgi:TonB family protein
MPVSDLKADKKADDSTASAPRRVSTGIVAPRLIDTLSFDATTRHYVASKPATVVLTMTVNASGKPESVAVAESAGKELDEKVMAILSQARFQAGTLDGQAYPLPLRLKVVVPQGTEY